MSDLSPLASLGRLEVLDLSVNRVIDLTPLANLERLRQLSLIANRIVQLTPLLALEDLQSVALIGNRLSAQAISVEVAQLRERGVEVILGE